MSKTTELSLYERLSVSPVLSAVRYGLL